MQKAMLYLVFAIGLTGCWDSGRSSSHGSRGSLSSALNKSSGSSPNRSVPSPGSALHRPSEEIVPIPVYEPRNTNRNERPYDVELYSSNSTPDIFTLGGYGSYMQINDDNFNNIMSAGLSFRFADNDDDSHRSHAGGINIGVERYDLQKNSALDLGAEDIWGIIIEIFYHRNFSPRKTFASPYIGLGLAFGATNWSYKNKLVDDEGNEITGDSLSFYQVEFCGGLEAWRKRGLTMSAQIGVFARIYSFYTASDFINDVVPGAIGIKGAGMIGYRF